MLPGPTPKYSEDRYGKQGGVNWGSPSIRMLVRMALEEDAARRDVTTRALIPAGLRIEAEVRAKQAGVVCGLPLAAAFFRALDPHCRFSASVHEGRIVKTGTRLAVLHGRGRAILSAERSALNALQHLSGIATYTYALVKRLKGSRTRLYDTRKTLPGWRILQKYAVRCGGGVNHRGSLAGAVLIKDNHLKVCRLAGTGWTDAVRRLKRQRPSFPIEIEVQTERDRREALSLHPDRILLDNMSLSRLRKTIRRIRRQLPGAHIEISGGVRPEQLRALSRLGADRVSMGRLTHSAPVFDCSLDVIRLVPN